LNYRNVSELARKWRKNNQRIERVSGRGPTCYHQVRYENLIADPEPILAELCRFLEVPYTPDLMSYQEGSFARKNARVLSHHSNLTRKLMSDNSEKWRTEMTPAEIAIYQKLAGTGLEHFGYPLAEQPEPPKGWRLDLYSGQIATALRGCLREIKRGRIALQWMLFTRIKRAMGVYRLSEMKHPFRLWLGRQRHLQR
jgi:hypothetical protein